MSCRPFAVLALIAIGPLAVYAEDAGSASPAAELQSIREQVRTVSENLTKALEKVAEHDTQIGQLKSDVQKLTGQINEEISKQKQILDAISRSDGTGRVVPRLSAAMQSGEFRQEMQQVVRDSLDRTGTLRITNKTEHYQQISVNRQDYSVAAGQTLTLKVPVGTVTTQLPNEEIKNWTVTAPGYEQNIEMVARAPAATYVYRPTYTAPPVYYSPWPYYSNVVYYWP